MSRASTSRAAEAVRKAVDIPVLTAPHAAVDRMRAMIETGGLTPGNAVTMWFVAIQNPEDCAANPCTPVEAMGMADQMNTVATNGGGAVVGADGRVYFIGRSGTTLVLRRSKKLEVLATNKLEDRFDSSPSLAGNQLFLRGRKFLYCIARGK